jgi:hypothetical protein
MPGGRIILELAAGLITAGGLYDLLIPRFPANLVRMTGENENAQKLVRELLRALGGALVAIGVATELLVVTSWTHPDLSTLVLILLLVVPAESINAVCMFRVGSPFYVPAGFVLLTILGVALCWPYPLR